MASFVIHSIAGEEFLNLLEKKYGVKFTGEQKNEFLIGNLIVDSSRLKFIKQDNESMEEAKKNYRKLVQKEKLLTHFRNEDDKDLCIQAPNLSKFENKYEDLLKESLFTIGYLFHLYTDKMFFDDLFVQSFECLDEDMNPTIYSGKTKNMRVKKDNLVYTIQEFWNADSKFSIYHDYTVMNKLLLEYYGSSFDKKELLNSSMELVNPGIEEVDINNIVNVLNKTENYINESYNNTDIELTVFDEKDIIDFINNVAISFVNKYTNLLNSYYASNIENEKVIIKK